MSKRKYYFTIAGLSAILIVGAYISIHYGSIRIPISVTLHALCNNTQQLAEQFPDLDPDSLIAIIKDLRLPRILAAIFCGFALSVSGAAYQSMFRNPLVSPDLLGVLAGSSFGALFGLLLGLPIEQTQITAFIFGIIAVLLAMGLSVFFPGNKLVMVILGGIFFSSLVSVLKYLADAKDKLPSLTFWLMGGFSNIQNTISFNLYLIIIIIFSFLLIMSSNYLNLLSMGDEEAQSLGINVSLTRKIIICITTALCATSVALGGMISWVGLVIPHIARMIVGPDNRQLLLTSGLIGGIYLLFVDDICRCAFGTEIPIGVITSLIGIPFFVFVSYKTSRL